MNLLLQGRAVVWRFSADFWVESEFSWHEELQEWRGLLWAGCEDRESLRRQKGAQRINAVIDHTEAPTVTVCHAFCMITNFDSLSSCSSR